eukprot:TRINITY_DN1129_c0_g1_i1.p1 TRINITY_DN1129_c0_g1~~TRINITY_DN1129_c0_g1_i1.p1  ORF type:complete len:342 (+),score=107.32 TRINITY_DN1129_c0_g1_i1:55-1080(+)
MDASEIKARQTTSSIFSPQPVAAAAPKPRTNPTYQSSFLRDDAGSAVQKTVRSPQLARDNDIFGVKSPGVERKEVRQNATFKSTCFDVNPEALIERPKTAKVDNRPKFVPTFNEVSANDRKFKEFFGGEQLSANKSMKELPRREDTSKLSAQEKKLRENASSVFGEDQRYKQAQATGVNRGEAFPANVNWTSKLTSPKTKNIGTEDVEGYAAQRKADNMKSTVFGESPVQVENSSPVKKLNLADKTNEAMRRSNHMYSDLFDQGKEFQSPEHKKGGGRVKESLGTEPGQNGDDELRKSIQKDNEWLVKSKQEAGVWREDFHKTKPAAKTGRPQTAKPSTKK